MRASGLVFILAIVVLIVTRAGADPTTAKPGQAIYESVCAACHGVTGEGNGPVAFAVKPPPRNFRKDPFKNGDSVVQIFMTITNGLPRTLMVGYPQLSNDERWDVATYVRGFRP